MMKNEALGNSEEREREREKKEERASHLNRK